MAEQLAWTYATLIAAIESETSDSDAEFLAAMQQFVSEGELRVLRDLDLEQFEGWVDMTINSATREAGKPTDSIAVNEIFVRVGGSNDWMPVHRRSFEYVIMYSPNDTIVDVPKYFCDLDADQVYLAPTPDISYAGGNAKARATIRPTKLSASNTTSWLGTYVPDLLFHACMIPAYRYLKHSAKVNEHAEMYASLLPGVLKELESVVRKRYKQLNTGNKGADD